MMRNMNNELAMIKLNDQDLENITGGKGYFGNHGSRSKLLKKKAIVNFFYWLLFDDKTKKKKDKSSEFESFEYDDEYEYEY